MPWLLGQREWLASMICNLGVWGSQPTWAPLCFAPCGWVGWIRIAYISRIELSGKVPGDQAGFKPKTLELQVMCAKSYYPLDRVASSYIPQTALISKGCFKISDTFCDCWIADLSGGLKRRRSGNNAHLSQTLVYEEKINKSRYAKRSKNLNETNKTQMKQWGQIL